MSNTLERLLLGNKKYLTECAYSGDITPLRRSDTFNNGQHPKAVVITCSDSRVVPEIIFNAGIGEIFVIRCAGNVMDDTILGSIEYAVEHLHTDLVMVLGHTSCGAVTSTIKSIPTGFTKRITDKIKEVIKEESDIAKAVKINALSQVNIIKKSLVISDDVVVCAAIYDINTGEVVVLE